MSTTSFISILSGLRAVSAQKKSDKKKMLDETTVPIFFFFFWVKTAKKKFEIHAHVRIYATVIEQLAAVI